LPKGLSFADCEWYWKRYKMESEIINLIYLLAGGWGWNPQILSNDNFKQISMENLSNLCCVRDGPETVAWVRGKKHIFMIYVTGKCKKLISLSSSTPEGNEESSGERWELMYCKSASSWFAGKIYATLRCWMKYSLYVGSRNKWTNREVKWKFCHRIYNKVIMSRAEVFVIHHCSGGFFFCSIRRPCRDQMHEGGECFAVERKIVDCRFVLPLNDAFACLDSGLLIMGIM
jgi:hypothetical protein